jgi:hypothetical protein
MSLVKIQITKELYLEIHPGGVKLWLSHCPDFIYGKWIEVLYVGEVAIVTSYRATPEQREVLCRKN